VLDVGAILGRFASGNDALTAEQRRVVADLSSCRTAALGGRLEQCSACGRQEYRYNSCRNRHCPRCQGSRRAAWLEREAGYLLPVEYHHVVFTLPAALAELARRRPRLVYGLLLSSCSAAVLELAADPKYLGAQVGLVSMLHTWGQTLTLHPHVHVLATGGGLSCNRRGEVDDQPCWRWCRRGFFLPVRVLSRLFRGKFLAGLRAALEREPLAEDAGGEALSSWLASLYGQEWVVYSQPPAAGPAVVLKYLARYVHRVAISNSRLRAMTAETVTFAYKDYRQKGREKELTLAGEEFARRFVQHVLPRGFVRVRHYGLLANRGREAKLAVCRRLLLVATVVVVDGDKPASSEPRCCAVCGEGVMLQVGWWPRAEPVGAGSCRGEDSS
jgi:Putative transposase/Transposase zinc-binding domain